MEQLQQMVADMQAFDTLKGKVNVLKKITLLTLYISIVAICTVLAFDNTRAVKVKEGARAPATSLSVKSSSKSKQGDCQSTAPAPKSPEPSEPSASSSEDKPSDDAVNDEAVVEDISFDAPNENESASTSAETPEIPSEPLKQAIVVGGRQYHYEDTGQARGQNWIDQDPTANIGTWGGQPVNSVTDNLSTHFIGHNPSAFHFVTQFSLNDTFEVYDATGQRKVYSVTTILDVDQNAFSKDGKNYWLEITGVGNKEQVVLQTCLNGYNRIVFAE